MLYYEDDSKNNIPKIMFRDCINEKHVFVRDILLYKCVNCGKENSLDKCDISLPLDILVKIFRTDKSLYYLSRMVSKEIRNGSLSYILQNVR